MTSEETIKEVISTFYCSKDPDIESFLKSENKAILFERKSKSRTYMIFDEDGLEGGTFILLAYFTIAMQTLKVPDGTAKLESWMACMLKRVRKQLRKSHHSLLDNLVKMISIREEFLGMNFWNMPSL